MNEQERKGVLTACLMAAFADGSKHERERSEVKNIAETLAGETSINLSALVQDVLLKRASLPGVAAMLVTPESRQLAFEMAVCVCDADGAQSRGGRRHQRQNLCRRRTRRLGVHEHRQQYRHR